MKITTDARLIAECERADAIVRAILEAEAARRAAGAAGRGGDGERGQEGRAA